MHGWLPVTVQVIAAVVLIAAVGRRSGRWQVRWLPWALIVGGRPGRVGVLVRRLPGAVRQPRPACAVDLGRAHRFRGSGAGGRLARRAVVAARRVGAGAAAEPAVRRAGTESVGRLLPHRADRMEPADGRTAARPDRPGHRDGHAETAEIPPKGTVVPVDISDTASGFRHRGELVYLPPAWYATNPPPKLPTVMMIGGEFNTPADWLRTGGAVKTLDDFAAAHHGNAPVFVFVDPGGAFNNDTECVNGSRGNSADHLTKDVVPYMVSQLRRQPEPRQLGHRRLVDGRHLRRRPRGDASGHVQRVRGHRRRYRRPTRATRTRPSRGCSAETPTRGRRSTRRPSSPSTAPTPGWPDGSTSTARHVVAGAQGGGERGGQERPGRGGELVVRVGHRQRDQLRGGQPAG